jgi:hypothetical protein
VSPEVVELSSVRGVNDRGAGLVQGQSE